MNCVRLGSVNPVPTVRTRTSRNPIPFITRAQSLSTKQISCRPSLQARNRSLVLSIAGSPACLGRCARCWGRGLAVTSNDRSIGSYSPMDEWQYGGSSMRTVTLRSDFRIVAVGTVAATVCFPGARYAVSPTLTWTPLVIFSPDCRARRSLERRTWGYDSVM